MKRETEKTRLSSKRISSKMNYDISSFSMEEYTEAMALWKASGGIVLSGADEPVPMAAYLERNPNMSFAAKHEGRLVGVVLCGHDGRRGYLHHLAVAVAHQRKGVGKKLVQCCLDALKRAGIQKCHLFLVSNNSEGLAFWIKIGWFPRNDMGVVSRFVD